VAGRRKKASRKRGASRGASGGTPPIAWFLAGLLAGVGISAVAIFKGLVPLGSRAAQTQAVTARPAGDAALIESAEDPVIEERESRFDFFTVLPEMEVVVPEQQLATEAVSTDPSPADDRSGNYILQAGSFRSPADADQLKARLALLGTQASIQAVTVNEVTWHRVRIGPVQGARRVDELRRMLQENGIDTLVLKDTS
jgi:cell division protein FtsN